MLSSWITDLEGSAVESDPAERETVSSEPPISPSLDNCRRFCVSTHDHRGTLLALLGLLHTARYRCVNTSKLAEHQQQASRWRVPWQASSAPISLPGIVAMPQSVLLHT